MGKHCTQGIASRRPRIREALTCQNLTFESFSPGNRSWARECLWLASPAPGKTATASGCVCHYNLTEVYGSVTKWVKKRRTLFDSKNPLHVVRIRVVPRPAGSSPLQWGGSPGPGAAGKAGRRWLARDTGLPPFSSLLSQSRPGFARSQVLNSDSMKSENAAQKQRSRMGVL